MFRRKLRLTLSECLIIQDYMLAEHVRLLENVRTGTGLTAIASDARLKELYALDRKLVTYMRKITGLHWGRLLDRANFD